MNNIAAVLTGLSLTFCGLLGFDGCTDVKKDEDDIRIKEGSCYTYLLEAEHESWESQGDNMLYEFVVVKNGKKKDLLIQRLTTDKGKYLWYRLTKPKNHYKLELEYGYVKEIDCKENFRQARIQLTKDKEILLHECYKHEECYKFVGGEL